MRFSINKTGRWQRSGHSYSSWPIILMRPYNPRPKNCNFAPILRGARPTVLFLCVKRPPEKEGERNFDGAIKTNPRQLNLVTHFHRAPLVVVVVVLSTLALFQKKLTRVTTCQSRPFRRLCRAFWRTQSSWRPIAAGWQQHTSNIAQC